MQFKHIWCPCSTFIAGVFKILGQFHILPSKPHQSWWSLKAAREFQRIKIYCKFDFHSKNTITSLKTNFLKKTTIFYFLIEIHPRGSSNSNYSSWFGVSNLLTIIGSCEAPGGLKRTLDLIVCNHMITLYWFEAISIDLVHISGWYNYLYWKISIFAIFQSFLGPFGPLDGPQSSF